MNKSDKQLIDIMHILADQSELNPSGIHFQVSTDLLQDCPDHEKLLDKLEQEFHVIEIGQRPNPKGYDAINLSIYSDEYPDDYKKYVSYYIKLEPSFNKFFNDKYIEYRSSIHNLTDNNKKDILSVMNIINDEIALSGNQEIQIPPINYRVLKFLERHKVIESYDTEYESYWNADYEREMESNEVAYITLKLNLPKFDDLYNSLINNTSNAHTDDNPIEYDEELGLATYKGLTKKICKKGTIMNTLAYRVIRADGATVRSSDILLDLDSKLINTDNNKSNKTLTNAKDRINDKFLEVFGIDNVIEYDHEEFNLNHKYCSELSPYKDGK